MKHSNKPIELKPLFVERMKLLLPDKTDFQNYLKTLNQFPAKSIRCNTIKISPDKLKKRLENKGWKLKQPFKNHPEIFIIEGKYVHPSSQNDNVINSKKNSSDNKSSMKSRDEVRLEVNNISSDNEQLSPGELGRSLEHQLGYYYVQEIASMLPILALEPKPQDIILDLCSAPGSKTTQTAAKMQNTGTIIANEISFGRLRILATNLQRCGVTNTIITKKDGITLCKKLKQNNIQIDKILIDAPCSGEGTLRSSPKTCKMWNIKSIKNLSRLQKALVSSAIEILKPNGELVYSTCTHAPEENEEIVDYILNNFKNMKIQKINLPIKFRQGITEWKEEKYLKDIKQSCRIYPQDNNTDGFFIAKFKKTK